MPEQSGEIGGIGWLLMDVAMVVVLAAIMVYATMQWRKRRNRERPIDRAAEEHKARQLIGEE